MNEAWCEFTWIPQLYLTALNRVLHYAVQASNIVALIKKQSLLFTCLEISSAVAFIQVKQTAGSSRADVEFCTWPEFGVVGYKGHLQINPEILQIWIQVLK